VRGVALSILLLVGGCEPDYGHSAFLCNEEHSCPEDQMCVLGRCRRGTPRGDAGVECQDATCDAAQQCCVDGVNPPRCIAVGVVCQGTSALCDGVDDCQLGDLCCADGHTVTCDKTCRDFACHSGADCPATVPNCCPSDMPWGECSQFPC
jgi:hypothetical protein